MRRLEKDESLCIGCHQCEEACSKAFYKVSDPMKSCIRITDKEDGSIILLCALSVEYVQKYAIQV